MKRAIVVLAEGFEEIEVVTPIDILRRAQIEVVIVGVSNKLVSGAHGLKISTDVLLDEFREEADALILPGGSPGAENLAKSKKTTDVMNKMFKAGKIIAAICAAPSLVLEPTGILSNKKVTCYPGMEKLFSQDVALGEGAVVRDGNLITSRGPATALSFSLAIVEALTDKETVDQVKERVLA